MDRFDKDSTADEVTSALASHIRDKTVLITGASPGGLGAETARSISRHQPALVVLAGRDLNKLRQTEEIIKQDSATTPTRLLELDLGMQVKVRKAAEEVNGYEGVIDCLINNAGIMASPYTLSPEGIESQFATNHIGHFLFTNLIMKKLLAAQGGARVINVSSSGHRRERIRFQDYNFENGAAYDSWKAYGQSKTANMLFSVSLADKLGQSGLLSFSLYPGRIPTNIARSVGLDALKKLGWVDDDGNPIPNPALRWKTVAAGPSTQIVAAFDPALKDYNGSYLEDCCVRNQVAEPYALDHSEAEKLWSLSEQLVGQKFNY